MIRAKVDHCSLATAEAFARRLTPLHTVSGVVDSSNAESSGDADFMELLALGDVYRFDPDQAWQQRPARDRLRVPIGTGDGGAVVHLDIKESAQQGMGPHGLVIGATGSGKSEFLRTLVLGLSMTHSPEHLNMVLVDFKGGATFAGMSELPHVSAVITNLAQELTLVDRMQDALSGEMVRRQELLREAGNFASIRDYEKARATGDPLEPLPSLFIVVDEFSEMLTAKPEFIDLFVAIGRLGRSLGLHLLLASQRLEEGRLRGLESHLSYRVGLRTFSAQESRAVLGVPDAYELPPVPGLAYLKPDPTTMIRFKAAYVSGPPSGRVRVHRDQGGKLQGILPFTISEVLKLDVPLDEPVPEPTPLESGDQQSLLDIAVDHMIGHGPAAHQVWLPPLDVPDTLDELMPDLAADPQLGLVSQEWRALGGLVVPLGTVDRPREQRRDTLSVDLSGGAGHLAVVGGPRSGKSTTLRSVVAGMSLTTTPQESQFFVLDFGGGTFAGMTGLPHMAGVGTRSEPDVVSRIIAEVTGIVDRREKYFRPMASTRSRPTGRGGPRVAPTTGTATCSWSSTAGARCAPTSTTSSWRSSSSPPAASPSACTSSPRPAGGRTSGPRCATCSAAGSSCGSATRWTPRSTAGSRRWCRPTGQDEGSCRASCTSSPRSPASTATRRPTRSATVSTTSSGGSRRPGPGRPGPSCGCCRTGSHSTTYAPRPAYQPRMPDTEKGAHPLVIGINEKELAPVSLDPDTEPHLLILGDGQSGKSSILRGLAREIMRTRTPQQAQLVVVDYRRALLGEVPDEYLLNYLTSANQAQPALRDLATYLENRIPGPDVTPDQLRSRSWWTGAEVFVLVDDYDLVATQQSSPVAALQPLLAQARDVGLHVTVARRSGGASRALYEPVIQSLRDLAMPG